MTVIPTLTTTITGVRAALKAILQTVTPSINVVDYGVYQQAAPPFWTIQFPNGKARHGSHGDSTTGLPLAVRLTYHSSYTIAAADKTAVDVALEAQFELMQRPYLQVAGTYHRGIIGIAAPGIQEVDYTTGRDDDEGKTFLAILTFSLPLSFQVEPLLLTE